MHQRYWRIKKKNFKSNINRLEKIKANADLFYQDIKLNKKIDLKKLGNLINKSWEEKKKLSEERTANKT